MKKTLLFLLSLLPCFLLAQQAPDEVQLKNGSLIRGQIAQQTDSSVTLLTPGNSLLVFDMDDVSRITPATRQSASLYHRGYLNITTFGVLFGSTANMRPAPMNATVESLYRFNGSFAWGAFASIEQINELALDLGSSIKIFLPGKHTHFYAGFSGGYGFPLEKPVEPDMKKAKGGIVLGAELGILVYASPHAALVVGAGYRYNELHYALENNWTGSYRRDVEYNRLLIRLGVAFR